MCFFFSFIPATILTTLSYFVWYAAGKAEGNRQRWGSYLAVWLLIVAFGFIACGTFVTLAGLCPIARVLGEGVGI
jgi:hypothetical protein